MAAAGAAYSLRGVQDMLGLSRTAVMALVEAGFVCPHGGTGVGMRFSFQDLLLLRTAHALRQAKVPTRRIVIALSTLRAQLPDDLPLTGLRISAVDSTVVVRDGDGAREVESGQWLIDFDVAPGADAVVRLSDRHHGQRSADSAGDAAQWFRRGETAEAGGTGTTLAGTAEAAYRCAIELDPLHADAVLNLGALLCEAGRCDDADRLYRQALQRGLGGALLHFNHAVALEDLGRRADAIASYERALKLDPRLADAHFNAGRLHEAMGNEQPALRHFSAYKRLQRSAGV